MRTIALATRARVLAAAKECKYLPGSLARSLRTRQTYIVGVIVPELGEDYLTTVMNAVEKAFLRLAASTSSSAIRASPISSRSIHGCCSTASSTISAIAASPSCEATNTSGTRNPAGRA